MRGLSVKSKFYTVSLETIIKLLIFLPVVTLTLVATYQNYSEMYKLQKENAWSIYFLELEQKVTYLQNEFSKRKSPTIRSNSVEYDKKSLSLHQLNTVVLSKHEKKNIVENFKNDIEFQVFDTKSGNILFTKSNHKTYTYDFIDLYSLLNIPVTEKGNNFIYITNNIGQLLFKNSNSIKEASLGSRELVKNFMNDGLEKGIKQINLDNKKFYGFYSTIPETNLILFQEISYNSIFKKTNDSLKSFLIVILGMLITLFIIVSAITRIYIFPIKDLTKKVMNLNFYQKIGLETRFGVGEVRILDEAINDSYKILQSKKFIESIHPERSYNLPKHLLPIGSGIEIANWTSEFSSNDPTWSYYKYLPNSQITILFFTVFEFEEKYYQPFKTMFEMLIRTLKGPVESFDSHIKNNLSAIYAKCLEMEIDVNLLKFCFILIDNKNNQVHFMWNSFSYLNLFHKNINKQESKFTIDNTNTSIPLRFTTLTKDSFLKFNLHITYKPTFRGQEEILYKEYFDGLRNILEDNSKNPSEILQALKISDQKDDLKQTHALTVVRIR